MKNILTLTCASVLALGCATDLSAATPTTKQGDAGLKAQVEMLMKRVNELETKERVLGNLTEKEAMTTGNNLNLKLSGQINRAILWHDDGDHSNFVHVDPSAQAATRFRIAATGKLSQSTIAGGVIEAGVRPNAAENIDVHGANATNLAVNMRVVEAFFDSTRWGKITLGHGWTAASRVTRDTDMSNTQVISNGTSVGQLAGGTQFVNKNLSSADPAFNNTAANKATSSGGAALTIARLFNDLGNGSGRESRVQYDTPTYWGTKLAASHVYANRNDMWDIALKHASEFMNTKIAFQAAYTHNLANTSSTDVNNTLALAKYTQWNGSISALFPVGVSLLFATTHRKWDISRAHDGNIYYGKVGYQQNFFEAGKTALALDYGHFENMFLNLDGVNNTNIRQDYVGKTYGAALVQHIDRIATELYLSARVYTLDGNTNDTARYKDITMVMSGVRVKF